MDRHHLADSAGQESGASEHEAVWAALVSSHDGHLDCVDHLALSHFYHLDRPADQHVCARDYVRVLRGDGSGPEPPLGTDHYSAAAGAVYAVSGIRHHRVVQHSLLWAESLRQQRLHARLGLRVLSRLPLALLSDVHGEEESARTAFQERIKNLENIGVVFFFGVLCFFNYNHRRCLATIHATIAISQGTSTVLFQPRLASHLAAPTVPGHAEAWRAPRAAPPPPPFAQRTSASSGSDGRRAPARASLQKKQRKEFRIKDKEGPFRSYSCSRCSSRLFTSA